MLPQTMMLCGTSDPQNILKTNSKQAAGKNAGSIKENKGRGYHAQWYQWDM